MSTPSRALSRSETALITVRLLEGAALALPAILQPGPLQAFYLSRSVAHGWRRTLPAAFAPVLTDGPIFAVVLFVLTRFPEAWLRGVQGVGGLFLLWLAWGAWRRARRPHAVEADPAAAGRSLRDGMTVNFLNPNPYLFWSTVAGPIFLEAWASSPASALAFVGGFYGTFVVGLAVTIVVFATLGRLSAGASGRLGIVSAVALAGFGVFQIVRALTG